MSHAARHSSLTFLGLLGDAVVESHAVTHSSLVSFHSVLYMRSVCVGSAMLDVLG